MTHREHWRLNGETLSPERQRAVLDDLEDAQTEVEELQSKVGDRHTDTDVDQLEDDLDKTKRTLQEMAEAIDELVAEAEPTGLFDLKRVKRLVTKATGGKL